MKKPRVLLADDHQIVLEGLKAFWQASLMLSEACRMEEPSWIKLPHSVRM